MKKFFLTALMFMLINCCAFCQNNINFIYINGSNTNDEKSKQWFFDGVKKFHPVLKNKMEKDPFVKATFLNNDLYKITPEPAYVFWGDLSKYEIETLNEDINILKRTSPKIAQFTRRFIAMCFHDAIWISKFPNMLPVLDMLHSQVLEAYKNGDSVVLLGYSAGTFVTYQYLLTKLAVIDIDKMEKDLDFSDTSRELSKSTKTQDTCLDALFRAEILTYNMTGGLVANSNKEILAKKLSQIDDYTNLYCAPKGAIKGVINYASPIALFYSDISDPKYKIAQMRTLTYKHLIENGIVYLTVNYADDPLGIPVARNLTMADTKKVIESQIKPAGGFYYDKSDVASPRPFFAAHTSYWATSKKFSDTVVKAYREGFKYFYGENVNDIQDL